MSAFTLAEVIIESQPEQANPIELDASEIHADLAGRFPHLFSRNPPDPVYASIRRAVGERIDQIRDRIKELYDPFDPQQNKSLYDLEGRYGLPRHSLHPQDVLVEIEKLLARQGYRRLSPAEVKLGITTASDMGLSNINLEDFSLLAFFAQGRKTMQVPVNARLRKIYNLNRKLFEDHLFRLRKFGPWIEQNSGLQRVTHFDRLVMVVMPGEKRAEKRDSKEEEQMLEATLEETRGEMVKKGYSDAEFEATRASVKATLIRNLRWWKRMQSVVDHLTLFPLFRRVVALIKGEERHDRMLPGKLHVFEYRGYDERGYLPLFLSYLDKLVSQVENYKRPFEVGYALLTRSPNYYRTIGTFLRRRGMLALLPAALGGPLASLVLLAMASYHAWRYNLLKSADRKLHLVSYRTTLSAKQGENMAVLNTHITALENQLLCASLLTVGAIVSLEERDPAATKSEARIAQEARLLLTDLYHWFSQLGKSFLYAPETVNLAIPYCLESLVRLGVVEKQGEGEEATYRLAPPSRHHPAVAIPLPDGVYA